MNTSLPSGEALNKTPTLWIQKSFQRIFYKESGKNEVRYLTMISTYEPSGGDEKTVARDQRSIHHICTELSSEPGILKPKFSVYSATN